MVKKRIFIDSSVIIAALLSPKGGSFYILSNLYDSFIFQTNEYAVEEMKLIISNKFKNNPGLMSKLFLLIGLSKMIILPHPDKDIVKRLQKYISKNDSPILASALLNSDYLITLDNEFFKDDILERAQKQGVSILKPKDFIEGL